MRRHMLGNWMAQVTGLATGLAAGLVSVLATGLAAAGALSASSQPVEAAGATNRTSDTATISDRVATLPARRADLAQTSVSGISSGAYMAGQFQLAHGDIVTGAAIIAGGPYGCAKSAFSSFAFGPAAVILNFNKAMTACMLGTVTALGLPNAGKLAQRAIQMAADGAIAPVASIKADRVYLFSGGRDRTVALPIVRAAGAFYRNLGVDAEALKVVEVVPAGHGLVTETQGNRCAASSSPYLVDCDYDMAGALLSHLYGQLKRPGPIGSGRFVTFNQRPFVGNISLAGLDDTGVAYIPDDCDGGGCRIHIAYHGCGQSRSQIGDVFIGRSGFARWAATNRLIVLFPQVAPSALNPQGCWDWWGYTGAKFLTRNAPQIMAVRAMLDRLAAP